MDRLQMAEQVVLKQARARGEMASLVDLVNTHCTRDAAARKKVEQTLKFGTMSEGGRERLKIRLGELDGRAQAFSIVRDKLMAILDPSDPHEGDHL